MYIPMIASVLFFFVPTGSEDPPSEIRRCDAELLTLPENTDTALDATLLIQTDHGTGSAVLFSPDGFALTAAHVVADQREVLAFRHDGTSVHAEVLRADSDADVALLRVRSAGATACLPAEPMDRPLGSDIFVLGSPGGSALSFSVSKGIISGYRDFGERRFVQIDASVNPGNSGGPVVSEHGVLVGIMSWKLADVALEGLSFAVPTDSAFEALGVALRDTTEDGWTDVAPVQSGPSLGSTPAPSQPAAPGTTVSTMRRKNLKGGLVVGGAVTATTAAVAIFTTALLRRRWRQMTTRDWKQLQGWNTAGWVLASVGGSMLAVGIALPKTPKREVRISAAPGVVRVGGRF